MSQQRTSLGWYTDWWAISQDHIIALIIYKWRIVYCNVWLPDGIPKKEHQLQSRSQLQHLHDGDTMIGILSAFFYAESTVVLIHPNITKNRHNQPMTIFSGWWYTALKNMLVSWDDCSKYMGKIKFMFQSPPTRLYIYYIQSITHI